MIEDDFAELFAANPPPQWKDPQPDYASMTGFQRFKQSAQAVGYMYPGVCTKCRGMVVVAGENLSKCTGCGQEYLTVGTLGYPATEEVVEFEKDPEVMPGKCAICLTTLVKIPGAGWECLICGVRDVV